MKKLKVVYLFAIITVLFSNCAVRSRALLKPNSKVVLNKYSSLLKESQTFLNDFSQAHFKDSFYVFVRSKEFNFNNDRADAVICEPIFISRNQEKLVIPFLQRINGISGSRIESVHFISAKRENDRWVFKLKEGYTQSFSYENNHPTLSDTEIGIKLVRNLMLEKVITPASDNDEIFKTHFYVW